VNRGAPGRLALEGCDVGTVNLQRMFVVLNVDGAMLWLIFADNLWKVVCDGRPTKS
jgi:hypothetical protein